MRMVIFLLQTCNVAFRHEASSIWRRLPIATGGDARGCKKNTPNFLAREMHVVEIIAVAMHVDGASVILTA